METMRTGCAEATEQETGLRLDRALAVWEKELTRSALQKLLEQGLVTVNGKKASKNYRLQYGDRVCWQIPLTPQQDAQPENIPLRICYEDEDLLVVDKPKGMVVHPAPGNYTGTLVNALLYYCGDTLSQVNGAFRPGIVHRIDKDTSGLLIVAKNNFAHSRLALQIQGHTFARRYQAVVYGGFSCEEGTINAPIGRSEADRKKMAVTQKHARSAVTHYRVVARYNGFTHLAVELETGRTHQIRVHMAHIGHPVAGDPVYGPKKVITELGGQCLHAGLIGFTHPRSGRYIELESPLPPYFTSFLEKLGRQG